ncbi:UvrD-helicase domain-containing protein [Leifsonia poae]|uniref:UvrD-helicase domain-containing protein n=1 Tax=Leifsonia poae TaxID=110933 RepID=UPI003D6715C9
MTEDDGGNISEAALDGVFDWEVDETLDLVELALAEERLHPEPRPEGRQLSAVQIAETLGLPTPTGQQQAVIEAPLGPAIVVAGAGSGKTETMANRVVWLLANGHVRVPEILGLTFTRKAAGSWPCASGNASNSSWTRGSPLSSSIPSMRRRSPHTTRSRTPSSARTHC